MSCTVTKYTLYLMPPPRPHSLVTGDMVPVLEKLVKDEDVDVRYFSDEAMAQVK